MHEILDWLQYQTQLFSFLCCSLKYLKKYLKYVSSTQLFFSMLFTTVSKKVFKICFLKIYIFWTQAKTWTATWHFLMTKYMYKENRKITKYLVTLIHILIFHSYLTLLSVLYKSWTENKWVLRQLIRLYKFRTVVSDPTPPKNR